ncbi:hypothetical protein ElyMa_001552600 [Elysia marginata]|uniref:Uncharacterized protein n=1 Tax=Elysia marginata TaxID=1093978 RepID=A0AAV4JAF9_9GAST|nr:hypothetical protein ElyMa_001552600 [Elysia marginata]
MDETSSLLAEYEALSVADDYDHNSLKPQVVVVAVVVVVVVAAAVVVVVIVVRNRSSSNVRIAVSGIRLLKTQENSKIFMSKVPALYTLGLNIRNERCVTLLSNWPGFRPSRARRINNVVINIIIFEIVIYVSTNTAVPTSTTTAILITSTTTTSA